MTNPNFFIVGAPKCGTTALSEYLRTHPQVFISTPKEPHYLAHDFPHYKKSIPDLQHYLSLFDKAKPEHLAIGEASVWYLYSSVAIHEIYRLCSNARIIIMLRNPIDLVQSIHTQMLRVLDEDVKNFSEAWNLQKERNEGKSIPHQCREPLFLQYGKVARFTVQIKRVFSVFPPSQVKIVLLDDLRQNPRAVYRDVLQFLQLKDDNRSDFSPINENRYNRFDRLSRYLYRPPTRLVEALNFGKSLLGIERLGMMRHILNLTTKTETRPVIDEKLRNHLASTFHRDVEELQSVIGRDLSSWLHNPPTPSSEKQSV